MSDASQNNVANDTPRASILNEANALIHGDRQTHYGAPQENFARIARLWSVYFGMRISPADVAMAMILLKAARATKSYTRDTAVDIAGYSALWAELSENTPNG